LGLSIAFVLIVLLVAVVIVFFYLRKQASKQSGKYYPSNEETKGGFAMASLDFQKLEKNEKLV